VYSCNSLKADHSAFRKVSIEQGALASCLPCDQLGLSFHTRNVEYYRIQNTAFLHIFFFFFFDLAMLHYCWAMHRPAVSTVLPCLQGVGERTYQTVILLKHYQRCGLKQNYFCGNCGDGRVLEAKWWKLIDCTLCVVEKNM
jgi:hypothetical protein